MTIKELQKEYELVKDDYWFHKPSNQWIVKHSAIEKIVKQAEINMISWETENTEMDLVRYKITMQMRDGEGVKRVVTSIGEADRSNCFSQYLGCMAEKRGIDRCVLKLINAYQYNIASEVEAEDFRKPDSANTNKSIEDEAEETGIPLPDKSQNGLKTNKNTLICPKCGKEALDQRVEDIDGSLICPVSKNNKKLPAFKCEDNNDFKNPICDFASWKVDQKEAGIVLVEKAPHKESKEEEEDRIYAEAESMETQKDEDLPF